MTNDRGAILPDSKGVLATDGKGVPPTGGEIASVVMGGMTRGFVDPKTTF